MSFVDVYRGCMECALPCAGVINRNVDAAVDRRHAPRGFYSAAEPGLRPVVMFVSTNPRGGGEAWLEPEGAYDQPSTTEVVNFQRGFVQGLFNRPPRQFQRNLRLMAATYLNLPWPQFAQRAIFTDLVKCTSPDDGIVPEQTKVLCATAHLLREVAAWNPVVVIALGDQAHQWLTLHRDQFLGERRLLKLPHPSRRGRAIWPQGKIGVKIGLSRLQRYRA
jgi:hypothetical protein